MQAVQIDFQNVQILSISPTKDSSETVLSFFITLPGERTMLLGLLSSIYSVSPNVISQSTRVVSKIENADLTDRQTENQLLATADNASQVNIFFLLNNI